MGKGAAPVVAAQGKGIGLGPGAADPWQTHAAGRAAATALEQQQQLQNQVAPGSQGASSASGSGAAWLAPATRQQASGGVSEAQPPSADPRQYNYTTTPITAPLPG